MQLSPQEINQKQFHDAWRGYNQEEVDDFLDKVAEVLDRVQRENGALHQRVHELEQSVATSREAEEMLKKTLVTAQKAAEEAIAKAKAKAEAMIREAEARAQRAADEARQRTSEADAEVQRRFSSAEREYVARKRELDASIERLQAFESELKQRLKGFLEQQMKGLESLPESAPPRLAPGQRQAGQRRVAAGPQPPSNSENGPPRALPSERASEGAGREGTQEDVTPNRRTVRSLFTRDEG